MSRLHYFRLVVEGRGDFPIDMLRHDECYPNSEFDSYKISDLRDRRQVELMKVTSRDWFSPTAGRWESFGWKVVSCEELHS